MFLIQGPMVDSGSYSVVPFVGLESRCKVDNVHVSNLVSIQSHVETLVIHKPGFDQNCCTVTSTLLVKIESLQG